MLIICFICIQIFYQLCSMPEAFGCSINLTWLDSLWVSRYCDACRYRLYYDWFFVFNCICAVLRDSLLCNSCGLSAVKVNKELLLLLLLLDRWTLMRRWSPLRRPVTTNSRDRRPLWFNSRKPLPLCRTREIGRTEYVRAVKTLENVCDNVTSYWVHWWYLAYY